MAGEFNWDRKALDSLKVNTGGQIFPPMIKTSVASNGPSKLYFAHDEYAKYKNIMDTYAYDWHKQYANDWRAWDGAKSISVPAKPTPKKVTTKGKEKKAIEPIPKVRLLDTVNGRNLEKGGWDYRVGGVYEVRTGKPDSVGDITVWEGDRSDWHWINVMDVEFVHSSTPTASLALGDKVRVIGSSHYGIGPTGYKPGDICTVTYIYKTTGNIDIKNTASGSPYQKFPRDSVERVEGHEVQQAVPISKAAFAAGDMVRCVGIPLKGGSDRESGGAGWKQGHTFKIDHFSNDGQIVWAETGCGVWREFLELVNNNIEGDNQMSEVSNNPVKAIMENELDADTRLLRQIGFENSDGSYSDNGRTAVIQLLYAKYRAEFATKYRKALAVEETAAKEVADKAKA